MRPLQYYNKFSSIPTTSFIAVLLSVCTHKCVCVCVCIAYVQLRLPPPKKMTAKILSIQNPLVLKKFCQYEIQTEYNQLTTQRIITHNIISGNKKRTNIFKLLLGGILQNFNKRKSFRIINSCQFFTI